MPLLEMCGLRTFGHVVREVLLSVRPVLLEAGRGWHCRPLRAHVRGGASPVVHAARGPAAIGLCIWICVRDAARSCRPGKLGDGAVPVSGLPILSLMLAIPAVAAILCLFVEARAARAIALVATLADLTLGILMWAQFDAGGAQWQFVERADRSEEHTSELQSLMR